MQVYKIEITSASFPVEVLRNVEKPFASDACALRYAENVKRCHPFPVNVRVFVRTVLNGFEDWNRIDCIFN